MLNGTKLFLRDSTRHDERILRITCMYLPTMKMQQSRPVMYTLDGALLLDFGLAPFKARRIIEPTSRYHTQSKALAQNLFQFA